MRILLTNDDGVHAPGLWTLVEAVRPLGEVLVVAPDREQSGVGGSVTLHAPIRAAELAPQVEGVKTWAVEGTPADSVILALEQLAGGPVDLVMAGINQGANLGEDILISGTAGAALQAYFRGIPAIAISVAALRDTHFEVAALLARLLAEQTLEDSPPRPSKATSRRGLEEATLRATSGTQHAGAGHALPRPLLLSVNLPNLPLEKIEGVEVTRMGKRSYADTVETGEDGKRNWYWIKRNRPDWQLLEGTDIYAVRNARVSITPLSTDLTAAATLDGLAPLAEKLTSALKPG